MLKVTVEIVPAGAEAFRRTIGSMTIGNISHLADVSDYRVSVAEAANPLAGLPGSAISPCTATRGDRASGSSSRASSRRWKASDLPSLELR